MRTARLCASALALLILLPTAARAKVLDLDIGQLDGILDLVFAYGILVRTEERDLDFVGIGNGGYAHSVNADDGTLNYDKGIVSNELRFSGDLTLVWNDFGLFVRGFAFFDFETQLFDRVWTDLSSDAKGLVGAGGRLQEYYVSGRFTPFDTPVQLRVGNQIINWGEGNFLRFGTDIISPLDSVSLLQPTASARDAFVPQGMIWLGSNVTENLALEAFYQYDWEPVIDPPLGWFFAGDDLVSGRELGYAVTGAGEFSDQGTNLDDEFGLPPGTLGFDPDFMRIPALGLIKPSDQGQYGFTLQALIPALSSATARIHFVNYHSRLPLISGVTADEQAIQQAEATPPGGEILALGQLSNDTGYVVTYPENIKMLGFSIDGATNRTGTLLALELSHHFNWPVQLDPEGVLDAALSPITDALGLTSLGRYGASEVVSGIDETHKTQLSVSVTQAIGPWWRSSQTLLEFNVGWVHVDGLQPSAVFDTDSWGYSMLAAVTYEGVLGGIGVEPYVVFTHDVHGVTPGPSGAFLAGRLSVTTGLSINYTNQITAGLSYTAFMGGKPLNSGVDRDFLSFNVRYYY